MKKILFFAIFCSVFTTSIFAQVYKNEKIAVYYFNVSSSEDMPINFLKSHLDSIYNAIIVSLTGAGLQFYPIDFLKSAFNYNQYDFPQWFEGKARKSNLANAYAKIEVEFSQASGVSSSSTKQVTVLGGLGGGESKKKAKVKCKINLKVVNVEGEDILKIKANLDSKDRIVIESESLIFGRFVLTSNDQNQTTNESLQTLVNETINELAKQIK